MPINIDRCDPATRPELDMDFRCRVKKSLARSLSESSMRSVIASAFTSETIIALTGLLASLFVVNFVGLDAKGQLFKLQQIAGFIVVLIMLGQGIWIPKNISSVSLPLLVTTIAAGVISAWLYLVVFPSDGYLTWTLAPFVTYQVGLNLLTTCLISMKKIKAYAFISVVFNVLLITFIIIFEITHGQLTLSGFSYTVGVLALFCAAMQFAVFVKFVGSDLSAPLWVALPSSFLKSYQYAPAMILGGVPLFYVSSMPEFSPEDLGILSIILAVPGLALKLTRHFLINNISSASAIRGLSVIESLLGASLLTVAAAAAIYVLFPVSPSRYLFELFITSVGVMVLFSTAGLEGRLLRHGYLREVTATKIFGVFVFLGVLHAGLFISSDKLLSVTVSLAACRVAVLGYLNVVAGKADEVVK